MKISDIIIMPGFLRTKPQQWKLDMVRDYYRDHGTTDVDIVVLPNGTLVDGYIRYLVLKENGVDEVDVKVSESYPVKQRRKSSCGRREKPHTTDGETIYVYGVHPNDNRNREYVWRVTNRTQRSNDIKVNSRILVKTKSGLRLAIVSRIEKRMSPPTDLPISNVVKCFSI